MAFYEGPAWQGPARQPSWDQPQPPSRSGANSATSREEAAAFGPQFEEVERAMDNLMKSGKFFPGPRRDFASGGAFNRQFPDFDTRGMGPGGGGGGGGGGPPSRHPSMDYDPMRAGSAANLQSFYATQRYAPARGSGEPDQVAQAKRRMAAQRERELRNYHQEQQYNRTAFSHGASKSDRSVSPGALNDEDRRDLIARQHRAFYGGEGAAGSPSSAGPQGGPQYFDGGSSGAGAGNNGAPGSAGGPNQGGGGGPRGPSPLAYNSFGVADPPPPQQQQQQQQAAAPPQQQAPHAPGGPEDPSGPGPSGSGTRSRTNSASSPAPFNPAGGPAQPQQAQQAQQASRTSTSSPSGSPPRNSTGGNGAKAGAPAPIGTRPHGAARNVRATPPANSPLSYGFAPGEAGGNGGGGGPNAAAEPRAGSAASNPQNAAAAAREAPKEHAGWGGGSGVWGKGSVGSMQASVWG